MGLLVPFALFRLSLSILILLSCLFVSLVCVTYACVVPYLLFSHIVKYSINVK
jgi:hypothetical protein